MPIFITGTDTDIGKTVVASWLSYHLKADYWKPVQTGSADDCDRECVRKLAQLSPERIHPEAYSFKAPLSPHLASKQQGVSICIDHINLPKTNNTLIIEGAGGVLTPLNQHIFMVDLMAKFLVPIIVVASSRLGTINHTCLTLALLRHYSLPILGVIINGPYNSDNKKAIEFYGKVDVLAELDFFKKLNFTHIKNTILPNKLKNRLISYDIY